MEYRQRAAVVSSSVQGIVAANSCWQIVANRQVLSHQDLLKIAWLNVDAGRPSLMCVDLVVCCTRRW